MDVLEVHEFQSFTPKEQDLIDMMQQAEQYMNCSCNKVRSFYHSCLKRAAVSHFHALFDTALARYDYSDSELTCPFIIAAQSGNNHALRAILTKNNKVINYACSAFAGCEHRYSALILACDCGHAETVAYLLLRGAHPHQGAKGAFPLIQTIKKDRLSCTQILLEGRLNNKASPNCAAPDESFGSLLHWALSLGNRNAHVKLMLQHGVRINLIRKEKEYQQEGTPLMVAVSYANLEGVRMLLDAKADTSLKKPFNGQTAKQQAGVSWNIESDPQKKAIRHQILQLLVSAEANVAQTHGAS